MISFSVNLTNSSVRELIPLIKPLLEISLSPPKNVSLIAAEIESITDLTALSMLLNAEIILCKGSASALITFSTTLSPATIVSAL